ncbi:hypothetical protein SteCoe_4272 [Stentor coeruleus]|uniref:Uncharacterized protein n=1 Tax=Stentor coeruleus TaxID=5963 RepID=A0A1R2CV92_9CILI|nr:hypothetical protein SteCoe_4272 [Stentor coeruleus]
MENNEEFSEYKNPIETMRLSNTILHSKSTNNLYNTKTSRVPTFEEIVKISEGFVHSKKICPETFPPPAPIKSQREVKLPRIELINSKKGLVSPIWFPDIEETPHDQGAKRFTAKPQGKLDSTKKIFPTLSLKFYQMPKTTSERFGEINPKQDIQLANYAVNSSNAFKTEWIKYKDLKNRKFHPEKHPEFVAYSKDNNIKRDKIVEYREAMLKVKAMMNQAWGAKK